MMKRILVVVALLAACTGEAAPAVEKTRAYGSRQMGAGAAHRDVAQTYDLYLPEWKGKIPPDAPFFLFVHGGAWMAGSKENGAPLLREMAKRGFVCASMNYALAAPGKSGACSFADMLRDIDLMVSHLPELFKELGLTSKRIALGGMSAGGHLSLLYAYDGANPSVLGLGLRHALPVACVYSDCGPTDLASEEFEIAGRAGKKDDPERQTAWMSVLSGGRPTETDREVVRPRLARFSPVALVTDKAPPTIALYGETHKVKGTDVGTDGIVARQNYDALTNRLTTVGATFTAKLTRYPHCQALGRDPKLVPWLLKGLRSHLRRD